MFFFYMKLFEVNTLHNGKMKYELAKGMHLSLVHKYVNV